VTGLVLLLVESQGRLKMKKRMMVGIAVMCAMAGAVYAALDAYTLLQNAVLLSPQETSPTRTETALVSAQSKTSAWEVTSAIYTTSLFYGKAEVVAAFSGNDDASYTNALFLVTGTNAALTHGTVTTQQLMGVEADAISVDASEIDFSTLSTYWAVRFVGDSANDKVARFSASLVHDSVPSATQTITGSAVDKMPFTGTANIIVSVAPPAKAAANFSGTVQIQSADASTGAWANVTGMTTTITGAAGGIGNIMYDTTGGKKYIRAVYTTTNDTAAASVIINSFK
jgi:hypothetical protein